MSSLDSARPHQHRSSVRAWSLGVSALALVAATGATAQTTPPVASPSGDVPAPTAPTTNVQDGGISRSTDPVTSGDPAPDVRSGEQTSATPPSATPDDTSADIVVTGIRSSLANSQNIKRNADTVVDAITAEDIGALPDRSVTEALQRVPGVSISRFAAANDPDHFSVEGSGIVVRGLNYVRSEFNGRDTFSANGGRALNFQDVPPELIGSVEVFKNMSADQIEGGIAGTVNLNTRKPFDSRDPVIYVSADMNYGDLEQRGSPAVSALFSRNFETGAGRFGVLVSGSYSQLLSRADSLVVTNYQSRFNGSRDLDGNGVSTDGGETDTFPGLAAGQTVYAPIGAGIRTQSFDRERIGAAAAVQFESNDRSFLATLQFLRSDARQTWGERAFETTPDAVNRQTFPAAGTSFAFDEDGLFQSGTIVFNRGDVGDPDQPLTGQAALVTNRGVKTRAVTDDYGANIKWQAIDRLSFNFDGQFVDSRAENTDFSQFNATFGNVRLDVTGKYPDFAFIPPSGAGNSFYTDPLRTYYRAAMDHFEDNEGQEFAFRADGTYDFGDEGLLKRVKFGARYADRDQTVRYSVYNWGALSEVWAGSSPVYVGEADTANNPSFSFDDVFRGDGPNGVASFYQRENIATNYDAAAARFVAINEIWASRGAFRSWNPAAQRPGVIAGTPYLPSEIYSNSEATKAAYARLDFGSGSGLLGGLEFAGNVGLRYVRTTNASTGFLTLPNNQQVIGGAASAAAFCAQPGQTSPFCRLTTQQQTDALTFSNGAAFDARSRSTFDHWLPSFNLRVNVTPKLLTRFAYSKAISRPGFEQLSNALQVSSGVTGASFQFQGTSRNANPDLRPVEANQFDLTAEWYFAKVGSLTAALFYKDLKNVVTTVATDRDITNNGVTQTVNFAGPVNSEGNSSIKGFEVAYQQTYDFLPGLLSGLGIQANYTYVNASDIPNGRVGTDTSTTTTTNQATLPLAGLSKHTVNAAVFYEKGPLSLRAAYNWRSSFLLTVRDEIAPFFPIYSAGTGQLDGSIFLTINEAFKIGVQGVNLLDEVTKTRSVINADGLQAPRSFFRNDRRFSLVTRLKF
ncbi:MAG TPA: TonB-dependent receptor [Sphingomonas sp.]|jgi:TonB-dependent receptor